MGHTGQDAPGHSVPATTLLPLCPGVPASRGLWVLGYWFPLAQAQCAYTSASVRISCPYSRAFPLSAPCSPYPLPPTIRCPGDPEGWGWGLRGGYPVGGGLFYFLVPPSPRSIF